MDATWVKETSHLPSSLIENSTGLSIDIGRCLLKFVFRSKQDYEQGKPKSKEAEDSGILHILTCPANQMKQAVQYVLLQCDLTCDNSDTNNCVAVTGYYDQACLEYISNCLKIRVQHIESNTCHTEALHFLCNRISPSQLFHPPYEVGLNAAKSTIDSWEDYLTNLQGTSDITDKKIPFSVRRKELRQDPENHPMLPCILCICGATVSLIKVDRDGSHSYLDLLPGGDSYLGLAHSFLGIKDFVALSHLALAGDVGIESTVDAYIGDLDVSYPGLRDDFLHFPMGKLVSCDLGSVQQKDMAFSLLQFLCMSIEQQGYISCKSYNIPNLYLCGNFVNQPLVRKLLTKMLAARSFHRQEQIHFIRFKFLQPGGYLGALGAYLLNNKIKDHETFP